MIKGAMGVISSVIMTTALAVILALHLLACVSAKPSFPSLKERIQQLSVTKGNKAFLDSIPDSEIVFWREESAKGSPEAQLMLSQLLSEGSHGEKDLTQAAALLRKLAEQGMPDAQNWLGCAYYRGEGVHKDYSEAFKWVSKSTEQGCASGQCDLAFCYQHGVGVERDPVEAAKWYRKSAE